MNVLVACEESQDVAIEFRCVGHTAYSCDVQDCSGGHPEWHIKGDVIPLLDGNCAFETSDGKRHVQDGRWDLIIAHPPCTYMSNAGACRMYPRKGEINPERFEKAMKAKRFFLEILNSDCGKICIENPRPLKCVGLPPESQRIQPWMFGEPYTKMTYLWLRGLPQLVPTNIVEERHSYICGNAEVWKRQAAAGKVYGKERNQKRRSKTFHGIAAAFAQQWGEKAIDTSCVCGCPP